MNVTDNLKQVLAELPSGVRLVAVSKFHPNEAIEEAYRAGQRIFGESKVQEMTGKYESLPKDIEWHFIGHLQTNKIKYMAPYVSMIHGRSEQTSHKGRKSYSLFTANTHRSRRNQVWFQF